ncbi:segregation and condensation protein B [Thermodesulfovibrio aggregans]|uniref:Segregation and condensation protein B n=1 Tax=Thermodesulfovibrio aggregans TaxID=86166 RepID=A0A0U9HRX3_9BACT|nr:SMC-Scp complex subunit ScpB [Thermodesulfovibrio aggregans]GAQ94898.1 segregation and condensation protein B [Thermodesulfovibrio aggregans]
MNLFTQKEQIKGIIESLLFVAEKPLSIKILHTILNIHESYLKEIIYELAEEYKRRNSGIMIIKIEDSYQMVTNPQYADWIKIFKQQTNNKLSEQALETLAIIAYKQPITKAEIEKIRGVNSDYAIKTLMEKKLIKIVGKKEVPGRPFVYGTTKEFLKLFGLSSLNELPGIIDFKEVNAA